MTAGSSTTTAATTTMRGRLSHWSTICVLLVLVAGSTVGVATGSMSTVIYGRAPAHASAPALRGQTWRTPLAVVVARRPHPRLARSSQSRLRALDAPFDEGMTDSGDDMPTVAGDYERADLSTAVDGSDDKASSTRAILPLSPLPTITAAALEPARIRDTVDFLSSARQWHAHPQSASALTTVRAMFHKIAMHGATVKHGHRRSSNDERSAMTASFRYLPRLPFVDAMRTVDALDYYLMLKRDNATIPFVVILRAEARLQRDVDRVQERIERAQRFRKDAAPDEPLPSFGRRRRTGNLVEELSTTLAFKRWELSAIQADRRAYPADDCDRLLLTAAQTLDEGLTDVSQFPSILKLLDELRRCDTVYFPWDFDHEHGRTVDPWTLFYTAERYFHQHDSPLDERLRVMAHLAYSVYQLPRSDPEAPDASGTFGRHDPWPMDILLLLEHYAHMAEVDVSPTTDALWIRLVLTVHQQFRKRCEVAALQPLTRSDAVRETTECFSAFRRALNRKAVDTDGVQLLQLYRTCAERARAIQGLGETVHSYELLSDVSFIHYVKLGQIIAREAMALPSSSETLENVELVLAQLGWDTVFFELAGDSRLLARAVRSRPFIVGDLDGW